jgi:ribose-phosphate pyrophosphokinase
MIYLNNIHINKTTFSGGELHIRINPNGVSNDNKIKAYLYSSDAIMQLLLVVDAIYRIKPAANIDLVIPYFPYARQDRVCNRGEPFSLKLMTRLINDLNCRSVTIYDPHSKITTDNLNNCKAVTLEKLIPTFLTDKIKEEDAVLVSPDKGSKEKVQKLASNIGCQFISADKVRDVSTGRITSMSVRGVIKDKNYFIIDDICDGGATFIELAKLLKNKGANELYLYVTHGIFSKGLIASTLKQYFSHIYCYHLVNNNIKSNSLTILSQF